MWVYKHTRESLDRELGALFRKEEVGFERDCHMGNGDRVVVIVI